MQKMDTQTPTGSEQARKGASGRRFHGNFTQQEPLPQASLDAAMRVLQTSRLHRYNVARGEMSEAALLEREVADWQGRRYCLALGSGGQALHVALRAVGVRPGDPVLANAFTLAPVPGAIEAAGATCVLVEIDDDLRIDFADLERKARESGARVLLLSYMRGHICDMDRLTGLAESLGLTVIEDCAHSMGASWGGVRSGNHGAVACFSTQTYKHLNSGEGGFLVTDDAEIAARATILSGSYMNFERHGAGPGPEAFAQVRFDMPNLSARMDTLRAAVLRPQLPHLDENVARWNRRYAALAEKLEGVPGLRLPGTGPTEVRVGSSIQFRLPGTSAEDCAGFVSRAAEAGIELKWFGAPEPHGFTSTYRSWRYLAQQELPRTDAILSTLFDMRIPLTFSVADCALIGEILAGLVRSHPTS